MLEKIYELKAKYETEMERLALKLEVLSDLLSLAPSNEEVVETEEELVVQEPDELEGL